MTENLQEIRLGDAHVGEVVIWKTNKSFIGDVYAEVQSQTLGAERTGVLADNGIEYQWDVDMKVWVDRPETQI